MPKADNQMPGNISIDRAVHNTPQVHMQMRMRWLYIMPCVFVTYSLAYLDRANFGFGAAAGLAATLHISDSRSALLAALFFLGYFLFQIPGASYARRKSAALLVFFALIAWGMLAAMTGVITNFWLLALDRLLLGVAESVIFPALLILLTQWFTRAERSRANTLLFLGNPITLLWMSAVTGYLIHAVGWQKAFIYEGLPSILWAFVWLGTVRDRPQEAAWIGEAAKDCLQHRLESEQTSIPPTANFRAALKSPSVVWLCLQYFAWSVGVYGFVLWLPTIIRQGSSSSMQATGLLNGAPYLLAIPLMLSVSYFSDRTLQRKRFVWAFLVISGISLLVCYSAANRSFWTSYGFSIVAGGCMYAPYGTFFAMVPEMLPSNVAGEVMALINSCGALGGFFGAWIVGLLRAASGNSRSGFLFMAISLVAAGLAVLPVREPSPHGKDPKLAA